MKWILLRGWAREARHWGRFPDELAAALPGATVRALDLPGAGALSARRSPASVSGMVDALREMDGERGARFLLGVSLGAMVCVEWAARYPAEVAGCVLLNTSLRPFSAFYERLRPGVYTTIVRTALLEGDALQRERAILRMTTATAHADAGIAATWATYAGERPVSRPNVLRQLLAAATYRAPTSAPRPPVLVLAGAGDRLVDPKCSIRLAEAWNVPVSIHPSAGHDLTLDAGPWVVARVSEWLRQRGAAAPDSARASRA